jgi:hypothetical protein
MKLARADESVRPGTRKLRGALDRIAPRTAKISDGPATNVQRRDLQVPRYNSVCAGRTSRALCNSGVINRIGSGDGTESPDTVHKLLRYGSPIRLQRKASETIQKEKT